MLSSLRPIGLDPSYSGLAISEGPDRKFSLEAKLRSFPHTYARLAHIRDVVLDRVGAVPCLIAIESYAFSAKQGLAQAGELGGVLRVALLERGHTLLDVSPSTLKKWTAGRGNAEKAVMLREVFRRWNYDASDDNDADAFALFKLAEAVQAGTYKPAAKKYAPVLLEPQR
jgi:Holliday junction resolvasome RuvABC endonuclease subunit